LLSINIVATAIGVASVKSPAVFVVEIKFCAWLCSMIRTATMQRIFFFIQLLTIYIMKL